MTVVDFKLNDLHAGLTEIKGAAWFDGEFLVIETETALFGEFNKKQHTVKIEPAALAGIRLDRRIVQDHIILFPKTRQLLDALPGDHLGEVHLKVWRTKRALAERLVSEVRNHMVYG